MSTNEENKNEENMVAIVDMAYDTALQPDADWMNTALPGSQNEPETLEAAIERLDIGEHWDNRDADGSITLGSDDIRDNKFEYGRYVTLTDTGYFIASQWSWFDDENKNIALNITYIKQELLPPTAETDNLWTIGPPMYTFNGYSDEIGEELDNLGQNEMNSVFDENGINTVGNGIGHDIELVIDNDYANSIVLNDYYVADLNTYKSGRINFELSDIDPGEHNIKIKVWDNYNNSSLSEINFIVVEDNELELSHVLNFPNPFTTNTAFYFEHNQNCNFLDVSILIYSVSIKSSTTSSNCNVITNLCR